MSTRDTHFEENNWQIYVPTILKYDDNYLFQLRFTIVQHNFEIFCLTFSGCHLIQSSQTLNKQAKFDVAYSFNNDKSSLIKT